MFKDKVINYNLCKEKRIQVLIILGRTRFGRSESVGPCHFIQREIVVYLDLCSEMAHAFVDMVSIWGQVYWLVFFLIRTYIHLNTTILHVLLTLSQSFGLNNHNAFGLKSANRRSNVCTRCQVLFLIVICVFKIQIIKSKKGWYNWCLISSKF